MYEERMNQFEQKQRKKVECFDLTDCWDVYLTRHLLVLLLKSCHCSCFSFDSSASCPLIVNKNWIQETTFSKEYRIVLMWKVPCPLKAPILSNSPWHCSALLAVPWLPTGPQQPCSPSPSPQTQSRSSSSSSQPSSGSSVFSCPQYYGKLLEASR